MTIATDAGVASRRTRANRRSGDDVRHRVDGRGDGHRRPAGWAALGVDPARPVAHLGVGNPAHRRRRRRPRRGRPRRPRCGRAERQPRDRRRRTRRRTRSRCGSTNAVSGSPRRAAPGRALPPWPRRGGAWSHRATGNSWSTWMVDVQALASTDNGAGETSVSLSGPTTFVATIEYPNPMSEHPVLRSTRRNAHRAAVPGAHRARRRRLPGGHARSRPTPASTSSPRSSTPPAPTRSARMTQRRDVPGSHLVHRQGQGRGASRAVPRRRRRHGRVRQRADARPSSTTSRSLLGRTAIDRTAVILDIFAQNAHTLEGRTPGRAGPAALPPAAPASRRSGQARPAARRRRHALRWRRDAAGGRSAAHPAPDQQARSRSQGARSHPRPAAQATPAQRTRRPSRSSGTPTPASRRCSTPSPTPACSPRTACSPRSTRRPGGSRSRAASRCCSPTRSASSGACRTASSRRSRARSRWRPTPTT